MKYETPEMTTLTLAINAIQGTMNKFLSYPGDGVDVNNEGIPGYQDWES
ncbi:MAG: hypothetical protein WCA13_03340 [Terriglobales bacterium]